MSSVATSEDATLGGMPDSPVPVPRGRRRTEAAMLIFAVALVAFAYANVGFGLKGSLPSGMAEYMLGFVVLLRYRARGGPEAGPLGRSAPAAARRHAERPGHRDDIPVAGGPAGTAIRVR